MRKAFTWTKLVVLVCMNIFVWIVLTTVQLGRKDLELRLYDTKSESYDLLSRHRIQERSRSEDGANVTLTTTSIYNITESIKLIARLIYDAKKHARGLKTFNLLKKASETMEALLKVLEIDSDQLYRRITYLPRSVSPEKFIGTLCNAPIFYKGNETNECKTNISTWKLITIIKNLSENGLQAYENEIETFLSSAKKLNIKFKIIFGSDLSRISCDIRTKYKHVTFIDSRSKSDGNAINDLVNEVETPYVLIARNVEFLTSDMRLERLISEIEQLDVPIAGGAFRTAEGHWKKGCFLSVYRNYTLRYLEGYDESLDECLFCDFLQGPFVTSKSFLKQNQFFNLNESEGLYEEWFLRVSQKRKESVVCPDSMFHVRTKNKKMNWDKFMKKWNLYKCVTPTGSKTVRKCASFKYESTPTKIVPVCSYQYIADAVKIVMKICEDSGIICELQEGTALGAVKLEKILPWERDADITFLSANYTAFLKLKSTFEQNYFAFSDYDQRWCCVGNTTAGGQFKLRYKGWNIELNGQHKMDSQLLIEDGMKPTKIMLDGNWVNVPRNPGMFVRNRYGREIYQHAEHWMTIGAKSGWVNYQTNVFQSCSSEGDHDCLDRYNADGDLPFTEMLP